MNIRLTTTGRRSGEPREIPLYGWADGDDRIIVVGSRGGSAIDPAWAHNLRADRHAMLHIGHQTRKVVAREADGDEHDRLWKLVCAGFPLYASYQQRTKRRIPLFTLESDAVD